MLAFRRERRAPRAASIQNVDTPAPGPTEVLLDVFHCGVCGSDLHAFINQKGYETIPEQFTFGHEFSGEVIATGEAVSDWRVGDHAVVVSVQSCLLDTCRYCSIGYPQLCPERQIIGIHRDGGMAEACIVDQKYLVPTPDSIDMQAASLAEPLSVAEHCVADCSGTGKGDLVVVSGPGIIGILSALVARSKGADVIVSGIAADDHIRLPALRRIGFDTLVVGPDQPALGVQVKDRYGRLADRLIEASGSKAALMAATDAVRALGTITIVGLYGEDVPLDFTRLVRNQIELKTSYVSDVPNYRNALEFLNDGLVPVGELVQTYPLADAFKAFEDAYHQNVIKPILAC